MHLRPNVHENCGLSDQLIGFPGLLVTHLMPLDAINLCVF